MWHAISPEPSTQRQALEGALAKIGRPRVRVHGLPVAAVRALGLVNR